MAEFEVHLDNVAVYDLLNGPDSPIVALLDELSERAAAIARAQVPVRKIPLVTRRTRREGGFNTAFPPGYTLVSIHANVHWYNGLVYGGIAAVEEPTIFLEYPAEQMHERYPFMSTAFDTITVEG